ncbi:hypothetical protein IKQ19_11265 [Candidatus Saccharibacteria bacterium]|nr:hypothetical protein [Candidatus Saccharibacteria bacterium]
MENIKDFIEQLFFHADYKLEKKEFNIYYHSKFTDFWIIVDSFSLEEQSTLFDEIKKIKNQFQGFERNLSILILNRKNSEKYLSEDSCIEIENDPFYFKKNVLSYTQEDADKLISKVKPKEFSKKLFNEEFFKSVENGNPESSNEFYLAYSIAQKLPFVIMDIEKKEYECESFYNKKANENDEKDIDTIISLKSEKDIEEYIRKFIED